MAIGLFLPLCHGQLRSFPLPSTTGRGWIHECDLLTSATMIPLLCKAAKAGADVFDPAAGCAVILLADASNQPPRKSRGRGGVILSREHVLSGGLAQCTPAFDCAARGLIPSLRSRFIPLRSGCRRNDRSHAG